jgi:ABC-2 type transport system ATP-binding protein
MMQSNSVFELDKIKVNYKNKTAVNALTLTLQKAQSLGLLGPNGAGKSSTIYALLGLIKVKQGTVSLFNKNPRSLSFLEGVGFAPEEAMPPDFMSGKEYLTFLAGFKIKDKNKREKEISEMLKFFDLEPDKKVRDYSKGMVRRLVLAQAFLGDPMFLILDEPLNGLDPILIMKLRERLDQFRASGGTVLYSSHILTEVEKSCTHVAILNQGNLVLYSTVPELVKKYGSVEEAFRKSYQGGE